MLFPMRFLRQQARRKKCASKDENSLQGFDKHQCIFVHIPKAAGVSLANNLFGDLGGGHLPIYRYYQVYSPSEFKRYFKFTIVRNPWDRLVSAYFFLKEGGFNDVDKKWYDKNISHYRNFDSFVKGWMSKTSVYDFIHFVPQYRYIALGDNILVDKVYRFESMDETLNDLSKRFSMKLENKHLNKTGSREKGYRQYYTKESEILVAKIYKKDVELFGYSF
jgi:hypothetical protein